MQDGLFSGGEAAAAPAACHAERRKTVAKQGSFAVEASLHSALQHSATQLASKPCAESPETLPAIGMLRLRTEDRWCAPRRSALHDRWQKKRSASAVLSAARVSPSVRVPATETLAAPKPLATAEALSAAEALGLFPSAETFRSFPPAVEQSAMPDAEIVARAQIALKALLRTPSEQMQTAAARLAFRPR